MFITPILYIILGISLGVGAALIFLQERFTKERRKLIALNEAEKVKSADMLKSLDTKWGEKTKEETEKNTAEQAVKVKELQEALILAKNKVVEPASVTPSPNDHKEHSDTEINELQKSLQVKETELEDLMSDKRQLHETLQSAQQEVEDLHGEIAFLKGEIQTLEAAKKNQPADDDFLVLGPGNHYIPGSVARNLMKKKKQ